jgi:hypothetical protein
MLLSSLDAAAAAVLPAAAVIEAADGYSRISLASS